jgi:serine protease Do
MIRTVTGLKVGSTAKVKILRAGKEKELELKVGERPGQKQPPKPGQPEKKKPHRTDIGMTVDDLTPEITSELGLPENTQGVVVSSLMYQGPADRAGLGRGDVIVEVDQKPVKNADQFFSMIKAKKSYLLRIRRPGPQGDGFRVVVLDLKDKK